MSLVNRSAGVAALTLAGVLVAGGTAAAFNTSVLTASLPGGMGTADSFLIATDQVTETGAPAATADQPRPAGVSLTPSPEAPDPSPDGVSAGQDGGQQAPGTASPSVRRTSSPASRTTTTVRPARVTSSTRPTHAPTHKPSPTASPRHSESESPEPLPSESRPGPTPTKPSDD